VRSRRQSRKVRVKVSIKMRNEAGDTIN
jgi:hypothetical protein